MPFPFSRLCAFLSSLEELKNRDPPFLTAADAQAHVKAVTDSWFKSHRYQLHQLHAEGVVSLLSSLFPERRTDRVYNIQASGLCRILCRCLGLSSARAKDLHEYRQPERGDLPTCLERVLYCGGPPGLPVVQLHEVDELLDSLAGHSRFSHSSFTKLPPGSSKFRDELIGDVIKRMEPLEAKWLARLILKDLSPVRINEHYFLRSFHFLLPDLLRFQQDFRTVIDLLRGPLAEFPETPDSRSERLHRKRAAVLLKPKIGIKVGRPNFLKARSIDHCMKVLDKKPWVLERKYDGEYCEVHVDLRRSPNPSECISIFSKSGKDSTIDRRDILPILVDCLCLGQAESKVKRQAILVGELVVYSDQTKCTLPFDEIRKHVSRSGRSFGTGVDSRPRPGEHLSIVFFDVLVVDDEVLMNKFVTDRRMWLRAVVKKMPGRAFTAKWKLVDFADDAKARKSLVQQFAASIAERGEGLVLKPCDAPYFTLDPIEDHRYRGYIKLKKDYIDGMGDEADFAVIGASYHAQRAAASGVPNVKYTDFYLGCLLNKDEVIRFDARPRFKVVYVVQCEACIPRPVLEAANNLGKLCTSTYISVAASDAFELDCGAFAKPDVLFDNPFVFEVLGSGFAKPSNCGFLMLRHARVKKLHQDRTWTDCVSMQELQQQGAAARAAPDESESQEIRKWIGKLTTKCRTKNERERLRTSGSRTPRTPSATPAAVTPERARSTRSWHSSEIDAERPVLAPISHNSGGRSADSTNNIALDRRKRAPGSSPDRASPATKRAKLDSTLHPSLNADQASTRDCLVSRLPLPLASKGNIAPRVSFPCSSPATDLDLQANRQPTLLQAKPPLETAQPSHHQKCQSPSCIFFKAVIYLAPCIATTAYITQDLLPLHNAITIETLTHWDRDSFSHTALEDTVSESQAYADLRKIVLVESRRPAAVKLLVEQILGLNDGCWRERVEVWDWKVLETSAEELEGFGQMKRWFLGATIFDEGKQKAIFVGNSAALRQ